MFVGILEAIRDWKRAEVKAGASPTFWGMDRNVGVYDSSLLDDWKELGRKKLTFGKFKGRTYLEVWDIFEEEFMGYCEWARNVEEPWKGLADFQLWLDGDPEYVICDE